METEKRRKFIIDFLYFAIVVGIAIFLCRYALHAVLPFLIALLVSLVLRPIIQFLRDKCRIQKGVAGAVVVLLFYLLIGFLLTILCIKIVSAAKDFFMNLPVIYSTSIEPWLNGILDSTEAFAQRLDPEVAAAYDVVSANITESIGQSIGSLSKTVVSGATSITLKTPKLLLNMLITVIATFYLANDLPLLREFILRQCSEKTHNLLHNIREHLSRTLWRYVKSYALILFITFCELCVGFLIIGIPNFAGTAGIIALFDILPVVGSGTVLLPWTIICVIQGNYLRALGLIILYVIVTIIRNILEPRIVGTHVGLHPLVTLLSMVVGTYIFGAVGLLGLPVTMALINSLNAEGVIHVFKKAPISTDGNKPKKHKKKKSELVQLVPDSERTTVGNTETSAHPSSSGSATTTKDEGDPHVE